MGRLIVRIGIESQPEALALGYGGRHDDQDAFDSRWAAFGTARGSRLPQHSTGVHGGNAAMKTHGAVCRSLLSALALITAPATLASSSSSERGFEPPTPFSIDPVGSGRTQLHSAAAGPDGSFYAAGFSAGYIFDARQVVVVKITSSGARDPNFGLNGVAWTGLNFVGGSDEIDIVVQNGRPIVSATVASSPTLEDRDIALVRLATSGVVDSTFGEDGVRILDLNTALDAGDGTFVGQDGARALALGSDGSIYLHATQRGFGENSSGLPRTDTDFSLTRLTANGDLDTAWGTGGMFTLDIDESSEIPRGLMVLADGAVIGMGYADSPELGSTQPVVYKLTSTGTLDTTFSEGGVFHGIVLPTHSEIYNGVVHGDNLVTAGYGRRSGKPNDYLSLRFSTLTGVRDQTWGDAPDGAVLIDPSGSLFGSNCRNAVALPNGGTALIGSTGPINERAQDAVIMILTADGMLDTNFGSGIMIFAGNASDQLWGGAVNEGRALFVGYRGTTGINEDGFGVILPLSGDVLFRGGFD
jgi:uncharacterized delta-60 repeat protein